jgi:serine/threonine protein kinase
MPFEADDRYQLIEKIGSGGLGEVWEAMDTELRRRVAIKLITGPSTVDRAERGRLRQEGQAAAQLHHEHIVVVHDVNVGNDPPFLVMELLGGPSLQAKLHDGPLAVWEAIRLASQMAEALAHAHQSGVIHRDIKPANLVFDTPECSRLKVCDFGIAQFLDDDVTHAVTSAGFGSVHWAPPEQWSGRADARSDLYALGAVLFAMLTSHPPFTGHPAWVIAQHAATQPPVPSAERPEVPPALDQLVTDLLEKAPDDRPQDAAEVIRRLAAIQPPSAIQLCDPPTAATYAPRHKDARRTDDGRRPDWSHSSAFRPALAQDMALIGLQAPVGMPRFRELPRGLATRAVASSGSGTLCCTTDDGTVRAIDLATTNVAWEKPRLLAGRPGLSALCHGDYLALLPSRATAEASGHVYCLDRRTGDVRWEQPAIRRLKSGEPLRVYSAMTDKTVAFGLQRTLTGVDLATGEELFTVPTGVTITPRIRRIQRANDAFLVAEELKVNAYRHDDGGRLWGESNPACHPVAIIEREHRAIINTATSRFTILDTRNGLVIGTIKSKIDRPTAAGPGRLIVEDKDHAACLGLDGGRIWRNSYARPGARQEVAAAYTLDSDGLIVTWKIRGTTPLGIARLDVETGRAIWAAVSSADIPDHPVAHLAGSVVLTLQGSVFEVSDPEVS